MTWVATGHGALDLVGTELAADGFEIAVTPTIAGDPVFLFGEGASFWRQLVGGGLEDDSLNSEGREIVESLEAMGLASKEYTHPARLETLEKPWLVSPFHELVYALVARVARENRIPILFIKGPTLHAQQLRDRRHSGDVDCWVLPGDDVRLAKAMREWGWTPLFLPFTGTVVSHSLTLVAGAWGCAIDVHSSFPGMRRPPGDVFRELLISGEERVFAGVPALTPDRAAHAVLYALHEMRPFQGTPPSPDARKVAAKVLTAAGEAVLPVVDATDSGYVLREPLTTAFPEAAHRYSSAEPPDDWSMRLESSSSLRHFRALRFVPLRRRAIALARLMWPTSETTRISLGDPGASFWKVSLTRLRRVGVSVRKLISGR